MAIPDSDKCQMMLKVLHFIETTPCGYERLEAFLRDGRILYGVKDVMAWTGWSASHIRQLCQMNKLPHIPGKELKFVYSDVMEALRKMQRGGDFRKRRGKN